MSEFTVTKDHIKLLKRMYVGWQNCETGAPEINPKRPYGNSGVEDDVAEILGWKVEKCPHCDEALDESLNEKAFDIHREMETVLQILVQNPTNFMTGRYVTVDNNEWKLNSSIV